MEECSSRNRAAARHQDITHFLMTLSFHLFLLTVGTQQQLHSKQHWQHTCSRGKDDHRVCKIPVFLSWIRTFLKFSSFSAGKFSRTAQTCSKTLQINNKSPLIHVSGQQNCTFVSHHVNQHTLETRAKCSSNSVAFCCNAGEEEKVFCIFLHSFFFLSLLHCHTSLMSQCCYNS